MASRDIIAEIDALWEDGKFDEVISTAEAALKEDSTSADDKRELQLFVRKATTHLNRKRGIKNPPAAATTATPAAAATAAPAAAPAAAAASTTTGAPEVAAPIPTVRINARYEWFQTAATVAWTVYVPGCKEGDVSVTVAAEDNEGVVTGSNDQPMSVEIAVKLPTGNNAQWSFCPLFAAVDPASVAIKYNNRNVEITVRKVMQGFHWAGLERKGVIAAVKPTSAAATAAAGISTTELPATVADALPQAASALSYPNSKGRDWSRFKPEEEDENEGIAPPDSKKHSGDEGLQKLFRKIYADADDDTKRAMMKSYQESGGTVLSTNWKEIGAKRTERKAPDGMVMKRWNKDSDEEDSAKGSSSSSSSSSSDDE